MNENLSKNPKIIFCIEVISLIIAVFMLMKDISETTVVDILAALILVFILIFLTKRL